MVYTALQSQGTNNNHNYSRWKTNLRGLCRLITIILMNMATILQNESFYIKMLMTQIMKNYLYISSHLLIITIFVCYQT